MAGQFTRGWRGGVLARLAWSVTLPVVATAASPVATVTNPILDSGADPWVVRDGNTYLYMNTLGDRLAIRRTSDLSRLREAEEVTVWTPPREGPNAISIWAPELHRIDGRWFIYYTAAASGQDNDAHRGIFVLEHDGPDPLVGPWRDRGRLATAHPGIDGTTFAYRGRRYFAYSPYVGPDSVLAIAPMANPWTLGGPEVIIARPDRTWERQGGRQILEGPEFLEGPHGELNLAYSASACWSDDYALGLLHARAGADPLDPAAWTKSPSPVLAKSARTGVYATGHNSFFTARDGRPWILYHGNTGAGRGCGRQRSPRLQPFRFDGEGRPVFGEPLTGPMPAPR
jgi:GH43 family beta-xylosidase